VALYRTQVGIDKIYILSTVYTD